MPRAAVVLLLLTCTPACRAWAPFEGVHIVQPVSGAPRGTTQSHPHGNGHHGHAARAVGGQWLVARGDQQAAVNYVCMVKIYQAHNQWLQHRDTHTPIIALRLDGRAVVQRDLSSLQRRRRWHHRRHGCASARSGCVWRPCRRWHGASASWQGVFVRVRVTCLQGLDDGTTWPACTTHLAMHACSLGSVSTREDAAEN
jgi:hypothetical protein